MRHNSSVYSLYVTHLIMRAKHTCMHKGEKIYTYICIYTYMWLYIYITRETPHHERYKQHIDHNIFMNIRMCAHIRVYMHVYTYVSVQIYIYIYIHTYIYVYIHTHIYTDAFVYVYVYIHVNVYVPGAASVKFITSCSFSSKKVGFDCCSSVL